MSIDYNFNDTRVISFYDDRMITFCKGPNFKTYVRQAINDELFWREWMNKVNLSKEIDMRIESEVPDQVKKHVKKIVPQLVEETMNSHYSSKFPNMVNKELEIQIPRYLDNSYKMGKIMDNHKEMLTNQLDTHTHQVLDRIVNDPSHQIIANAHIKAIDEKGKQKIDEISFNAKHQLCTHDTAFNKQLENMKLQVNNDLNNLSNSLAETSKLRQQVTEIKNEIIQINKEQQKEISGLKIAVGILSFTTAMFFGLFIIAKN